MEYSVGSLADLITGKNTPNKQKVIKKEFVKKTKQEPENISDDVEDVASEIYKPVKSEKKLKKAKKIALKVLKQEFGVSGTTIIKRKNKKRELDDGVSETMNIETKIKKKNKERKPDDGESGNTNIETKIKKKRKERKLDDGVSETTNIETTIKKKSKKRKLDDSVQDSTITSTASLADSDIDDPPTPPKKVKLTEYEQNAERRVKKKEKAKILANPETKERTVFVGNIPVNVSKKHIKRVFKKYGNIDTIRIRGITPADPKTPKKVAVITKEFNPNRTSVYCFIRFCNKEDAEKAIVENGKLFENHHMRVHLCEDEDKPDESKAIFIGNLSFDAEDEELWKLFEPCGPISHVRIVRDTRTGMGKGFGYVNFVDSDSVQLALQMENVTLKKRVLRISLCNLNRAKKTKNRNKNQEVKKAGKPKFRPRSRFGKNKQESEDNEGNYEDVRPQQFKQFQGSKFDDKKKKFKINKGLLQKKKLAKKIAPKPS